MKRVTHVMLLVAIVASATPAAARRTPTAPIELGFPADIANINNRGDVVARETLWASGDLIDLGRLPDGAPVSAFAINERRQVVGWAFGSNGLRGFLWQNGVLTELGTFGGDESTAFDVNNRGQVLGVSRTADNDIHGFVFTAGTMLDIGPVAFASAINNRGQVAGGSFTPAGSLEAFIWTNGSRTHLGVLPGADYSTANDINDRRQVVGQSQVGEWTRAFLWDQGRMVDLGTLPGGLWAVAYKINNRGQVVGWGGTSEHEAHGILWQDGVAIDLGTLPGGSYSFATGINERGDIAGASENAADVPVAVLWTTGGGGTRGIR